MGIHCCCSHVNYIVYKHFDKSLHVGIQTEEDRGQRQQGDLEKWTFCCITHVNGPIQTKFLVDIHNDLGYHPAVAKVDYD